MNFMIMIVFTFKLSLLGFPATLESLINDIKMSEPQRAQVMEITREFMSYYRNTQKEMDAIKAELKSVKYSPYAIENEYAKITDDITQLNIEREHARLDYFFLVKERLNEDQWEDFVDEYFDIEPLSIQPPPGGMPGTEGRMPGKDDAGRKGDEGGKMPEIEHESGGGMYGGMPGPGQRDMKKLGVYAMLDLSNEQKIAIKDILELQSAIKEETNEAIETRDRQIEDAQSVKNPDKEKILTLINEREQKKGEIEKILYKYDLRIMQLLTLDQRKDLFDLMMDAMRGGRRPQPPSGGHFPER